MRHKLFKSTFWICSITSSNTIFNIINNYSWSHYLHPAVTNYRWQYVISSPANIAITLENLNARACSEMNRKIIGRNFGTDSYLLIFCPPNILKIPQNLLTKTQKIDFCTVTYEVYCERINWKYICLMLFEILKVDLS